MLPSNSNEYSKALIIGEKINLHENFSNELMNIRKLLAFKFKLFAEFRTLSKAHLFHRIERCAQLT